MFFPVSAASVGAAPGFIDIGEVERGETVERPIYITTNVDENFVVEPSLGPGRPSVKFSDGHNLGKETSDQEIKNWITLESSVDVNSSTQETVELSDGSSTNVEGEFEFTLEVPRDAEPGYHYGMIRLNPDFDSNGDQAGTRNWGETIVNFRFRVPGEAERSVRVERVEGLRSGDNSAVIQMDVRNTGSVTVNLRDEGFEVHHQNGSDGVYLDTTKIAPGEVKTIDTSWNTLDEDLRAGEYRIQGQLNYMTGDAFVDETFSINDFIEIRPSNNETSSLVPSGDSSQKMPTMLILMFLVLMGSIMYVFELDPLLIVMAVAILGISFFIWFSGLPMFLMALLLIISAGIFYYGWM